MSSRSGALRRRRKRSLATRLRIVWVFIVVGFAAVAYGAYSIVTLPALRVHAVDVTVEGSAVDERTVRRVASIDLAGNVWLVNTWAVARRIEAIPYVNRAIVRHVPPASLAITVTQRRPAACVTSGRRVVTVDATRRILQDGCARHGTLDVVLTPASLGALGTTIAAPDLARLLADAAVLRTADLPIRKIARDRFGELIAIETGGVELRLGADGDGDLRRKAALVKPITAAAPSKHTIRAIDVREPATPTIEFR